MKHFYALINPSAGSFSERRISRFVSFLEREGAKVTLCMPHDREEAISRARSVVQESTATHLLVGGGDGTIADIAAEMVGSALVLCILPIGTVNVLAHELRVPIDDRQHARHLVSGATRKIWPGVGTGPKGDELFIQMAGFGWDGAIVGNVSAALKACIGRYAYAVSGIITWLRYQGMPQSVWIDDIPYQCVSLIVSKGRFYGGKYTIAPETRHFGKSFNVIIIRKIGVTALLRMLCQSIFHGTFKTSGVADVITAQRVVIAEDAALPVQMDGDACLQKICILESSKNPLWVAY